MSSFEDAFALPVARSFNGKEYLIPRLTNRDYLPWMAELEKEYRDEDLGQIPNDIKPRARYEIERDIKRRSITIDNLRPKVVSGTGAIRVIEIAARKITSPEPLPSDQIEAFVDSADARQNERDSFKVSGLFSSGHYFECFPDQVPSWAYSLMDAAENDDESRIVEIAKTYRKWVDAGRKPPKTENEESPKHQPPPTTG